MKFIRVPKFLTGKSLLIILGIIVVGSTLFGVIKFKNEPLVNFKRLIEEERKTTEKIKREREKSELVKLEKKLKHKERQITRYQNDVRRLSKEVTRHKQKLAEEMVLLEREKNRIKNLEKDIKDREKKIQEKEKGLVPSDEAAVVFEEENLGKLAKIYAEMSPDIAADTLNNFEDELLLVEILSRIKEDDVARILGEMDPKRSADISKMLAIKKAH